MTESFFNKLHNLTSKINDDVNLIQETLLRPKSSIPSNVGASKVRSMENDLRSLTIDMETAYYDFKTEAELSSKHAKTTEDILAEIQGDLDLVEMRLQETGDYKPWRDTQPKVSLAIQKEEVFSSPNPCGKKVCAVTPIVSQSPRTDIVTPVNKIRISSTPSNQCLSKTIGFEIPVTSKLVEESYVTPTEIDTHQLLHTVVQRTPEEPVLNLNYRKKYITNKTPEKPSSSFTTRLTSSITKLPLGQKTTPEEPVLCSLYSEKPQCPGTPKEPVLGNNIFKRQMIAKKCAEPNVTEPFLK